MKVLRRSDSTTLIALLAVVVTMFGALISHAATAEKEKAVEGFPAVLKRDITLWSDGTRLSGVLLYPKDCKEGEKLPAIVLCNGWGGTKAFLMRSGIAPRFAAAGYVVINYDYRGWGDSDSRLVVRDESGRVRACTHRPMIFPDCFSMIGACEHTPYLTPDGRPGNPLRLRHRKGGQ